MGLAIGALLAPAAAISAAGLVKIVGSSGKQAQVNAANQLFTAPTSPTQFRSRYTFGVGNACQEVYAAPVGKGSSSPRRPSTPGRTRHPAPRTSWI